MASATRTDNVSHGRIPFGPAVDWLVAAFLVSWGLVLAGPGAALAGAVDRSRVARWVAEGRITSTELSDAELVDVTVSLGQWGATGLVVTGGLLAAAGVLFLVVQRRSRRRVAAGDATGTPAWTTAVVGAVVTSVLTVVPLSPVLGGAVAGYVLRGDRSARVRVGALAGALAAVPVAVLFAFLGVGLSVLPGPVALFVGLATLFALAASVLYLVALGALGGYLSAALVDRDDAGTVA